MSALGILLVAIIGAYLAWWAWDERSTLAMLARIILGIDKYDIPDVSPISVRELTRMDERINNIGRIAFPGYDRFEAWTQCPNCERIAVHAMRKPKPKPVRGPIRVIEREDGSRDEIWAFSRMTTAGPDESGYDTIRTCECGQEWGQK